MNETTGNLERAGGRADDELRTLSFEARFTNSPDGSLFVRQGQTWVLCTACTDEWLPRWRRGSGKGWLTASYSMLPGSTMPRRGRDRQGAGGRTKEIERLIGRSLRSALDLAKLGERTMFVDCDVLQADGGTRTAAVVGGWVAVALAIRSLRDVGTLVHDPLTRQVAAVSVGMVDDRPLLDLDYTEDVRAQTDMNVVMASEGDFVEIQGTAEKRPFARGQLDQMLDLAQGGLRTLFAAQREALL